MIQKAYFLKAKFFSKASRKFSMRRMTMFNISGSLSKIISLRSKKNWGHTTHQSEDIDENLVHIGKTPVVRDFPSDHCRQSTGVGVHESISSAKKFDNVKCTFI